MCNTANTQRKTKACLWNNTNEPFTPVHSEWDPQRKMSFPVNVCDSFPGCATSNMAAPLGLHLEFGLVFIAFFFFITFPRVPMVTLVHVMHDTFSKQLDRSFSD